METRLGHCLFVIFSEWIWLFSLTSSLGGTKGAEVRCIPPCRLSLITAFPRELSALDLTNSGETPAEEFVGFFEGSPGAEPTAGGEEKPNVAEFTASEETSSKVQPRLRGNKTSCLQEDASNGQQKLSHSKEFPAPLPTNVRENGTGDAKNNSFYGGNGAQVDVTVNEDEDVASWRRARRSAETWSRFRPEGGDEASFSDQEEFQLISSTFALSGDTAHNQAMVHWSGQNSSHTIANSPVLDTDACSSPHIAVLSCSDNPVADAVSMDLHQLPSLLGGCDGQAAEGSSACSSAQQLLEG